MLDLANSYVTIAAVGREDRALLRNNPSDRSDAGRWTGAFEYRVFLPSLPSFGFKAINLFRCGEATSFAKGNQKTRGGRTYVSILGGTCFARCPLRVLAYSGFQPRV